MRSQKVKGKRQHARTYQQAGVDIHAAERLLARVAPMIRATHGPEVLRDLGQFAGLYHLANGARRDPVLVSSTDGAGTKITLAQQFGAHEAIGVYVVAMNVNDVITYGARPLFFLDYLAMGTLKPATYTGLLRGIARGCREAGCALLGGETAEMPGVYAPGEYDVAGFCVGVAERRKLIDGSAVRAGDVVVGLASSGVHANGFSLVRAALSSAALKRLHRPLLRPTRLYVKPVLAVCERFAIHAIAHVTGGGLSRRLPSVVKRQPRLRVRWSQGTWPVPEIFREIQRAGRISAPEMYRTFNMGIGMVLVCRRSDASAIIRMLGRLKVHAWIIGEVVR